MQALVQARWSVVQQHSAVATIHHKRLCSALGIESPKAATACLLLGWALHFPFHRGEIALGIFSELYNAGIAFPPCAALAASASLGLRSLCHS